MLSMVAKGSICTTQLSPCMTVQEKGSSNKRKFRADPPLTDANNILPLPQMECASYEFSAEKFDIGHQGHGQTSVCDLCFVNQDHSDGLKLDLGLSGAVGSSEVGPSRPRREAEAKEFQDADWSDRTETQLEELVLTDLDTIFKSAIKKIVACGYTEDVATRAVLRSGLCYGSKDTVSNIVDNTLVFLRSGQEIDPLREHYFEDLQQLEKYILAELVCVLREIRPSFSTGAAMWRLLICDMNVSLACAVDGDPISSLHNDDIPSPISNQPQSKTEAKTAELGLLNAGKPFATLSGSNSQPETSKPRISGNNGLTSDGTNRTSPSLSLEEKLVGARKIHSVSTKRDLILRQKSLHLEKNYRTYGGKGSSGTGKLSGLGNLVMDKKLKSVSDSTALNLKNASLKISKAMGVDLPKDNGNQMLSSNAGPSSPAVFSTEAGNGTSVLPLSCLSSIIPSAKTPPTLSASIATKTSPPPSALSAADTELSLSLSTKSNTTPVPVSFTSDNPTSVFAGIPFDKSSGQWVPRDKKDEMILKLEPRVRDLQNQLQEWTEWANQKVMQAARRLGKEKAELKSLRQEKEEVERLKKEKITLEENTMKKLAEMDNALCKASGQVEKANFSLRRLEVENAALRQEMEAAKLRAAESAANFQELTKREKKTLMNFQSWEKQKVLFNEELVAEKRRLKQLLQEVDQAKSLKEQWEARWHQEEKSKEELLEQASSIRKEREQLEASSRTKEDQIKQKAESNLQKCKNDIQKLEKEISQLRLNSDSSKIAALRRGVDGSYAKRDTNVEKGPNQKISHIPIISEVTKDVHGNSETGGVKRERECVMCLSEEMSVVFLPCAHQVVCRSCNELHEKQGMKECPSCRSPIQRRIPVGYARS